MAEAEDDAAVELLLLKLPGCHVYKVPPLRTASGHRAEEWSLTNPLFTGCLKVFQADLKLRIALYSYKDANAAAGAEDNLNLFGECPVEVKPGENILGYVDGVIDSSRYYVLRIKDPRSSRTTHLGIGFDERDAAFELKNCLNEYVKYVNRMQLASQMASQAASLLDGTSDAPVWGSVPHAADAGSAFGEDGAEDADSGPSAYRKVDQGATSATAQISLMHIAPLKEGEKIKIKIKGGKEHATDSSAASGAPLLSLDGHPKSSPAKGGGFALKPPPPAPAATVFSSGNNNSASSAATEVLSLSSTASLSNSSQEASGDDEWGDFSSS